ncbi:MAG: sterol desaturase family protein [Tepidiformaceae bacterium]
MGKIFGLLIAFVVLSIGFGLVERRWPSKKGQRWWRSGIKTDFGWWFFDPIVGQGLALIAIAAVVIVIAKVAGVPVDKEHIKEWVSRDTVISSQPGLLQAVEALLWFELIGYWSHRAFHQVGVLWRYHAIHHSSTEVDWLSAVRVHPVNEIGSRLAQAIPLVLVGYNAGVVATFVPLLTFYAIMLHANVSWDFGTLRYVIGSPVYHRWHHTSEQEGLDKDFAAMFPWMDWLFGTLYFPKDRQPMEFGVLGEVVPNNLWKQLVYPFRKKSTYSDVGVDGP